MQKQNAPALVVARFLQANHYNETLEAFRREAGLPDDAGTAAPGDWSIEQILQEKVQFDTSLTFEKYSNDEDSGWTQKAPTQLRQPGIMLEANVLFVAGLIGTQNLSITTADRKWRDVSTVRLQDYVSDDHATFTTQSPLLHASRLGARHYVTSSMGGHITLRNADDHHVVDERRDHHKYAVATAVYRFPDCWVIATAGWDQRVLFYTFEDSKLQDVTSGGSSSDRNGMCDLLGEPVHVQRLASNPESLLMVEHPDTREVYLVVTRRDSTHLHYYKISQATNADLLVEEGGRQNLAPHSNAWVSFTPCSLSSHPSDPCLVAVATSALPHMKLLIVRLLFPNKEHAPGAPSAPANLAAAVRAELALQHREDDAIRLHVNTLAPQTAYSTPQVVWRPDGSGVFVNGDDGVIRGIEATTGKVVVTLKGHEVMSKVRTLWCGMLALGEEGEPQEILVSGGFDKQVLLWVADPVTR